MMFSEEYLFIKKDKVSEATIKIVIIVIGVLGNSMSLYVLTRNKIKTKTIYLIAISTADLLRLISAISNVLEYFQWIHLDYEFYWQCRPTIQCIKYSTQSMSLLFILSFSINRYFAIKCSFKRHVLEKRKSVTCIIFAIVILCILPRIPIVKNLMTKDVIRYNKMTKEICSLNETMKYNTTDSNNGHHIDARKLFYLNFESLDKQKGNVFIDNSQNGTGSWENLTNSTTDSNETESLNQTCTQIFYYMAEHRKQNRLPSWYRLTIVTIFGVIPTLALIAFNIKLILLLKQSNRTRSDLTNSSVIQTNGQQNSGISKENKAILQLITIKAVIAVLRIPYFFLMYFLQILIKHHSEVYKVTRDISAGSLDLNSTLNFFLFCILPSHSRKEFVDVMSKLCCKFCMTNKNKKTKICRNKANPIINGHNNIAFICNETQSPTLGVRDFPGDLPQNHNNHKDLHEVQSYSSSSSGSSGTTYSSQISQTSDISRF